MYLHSMCAHCLVAHSTSEMTDDESFIVTEVAMGTEFRLSRYLYA